MIGIPSRSISAKLCIDSCATLFRVLQFFIPGWITDRLGMVNFLGVDLVFSRYPFLILRAFSCKAPDFAVSRLLLRRLLHSRLVRVLLPRAGGKQ